MKDFYRKLLESTNNLSSSLKIPLATFRNFSDIIKRNQDAVEKLNKVILEQHNAYLSIINNIKIQLPKLIDLENLSKQVSEITRKRKDREKILLESGWWATPSIMQISVSNFSLAFSKYSKGNKRAITDLFISVYQSNSCSYLEHTVKNWNSNKYFKPWEKQLKEALKAHKRKEYNTAIPTLLLAAEGIAKDYCKTNKIAISNKIQSKGNKKIILAINSGINSDNIDDIIGILEIDIFFAALENRIYTNTEKIKNEARGFRHYLNRHAILHGESKNYGTLKNSIQSFMLLDVLSLLK